MNTAFTAALSIFVFHGATHACAFIKRACITDRKKKKYRERLPPNFEETSVEFQQALQDMYLKGYEDGQKLVDPKSH